MKKGNQITGIEELQRFSTSQDLTEYEKFFLFSTVTDEELKKSYIETGSYKPGYCWNPEIRSEFKRRRRYRIRDAKRLRNLYNGLNRSTSEINMQFRIKVSGIRDGIKYNKLVGVSGLLEIIGLEFSNKFIDRAFNSSDDKVVCKLRTGLKITFYSK
jgi:hypothetical protein